MPVDAAAEAIGAAIELGAEMAVSAAADTADGKRNRKGCWIGMGVIAAAVVLVLGIYWFG